MRTIFILAGTFVVLLVAPILFAALYYKARKAEILHINQDKTRDARFFGKSFSAMVRGHIDAAQGGVIRLSRDEPYVDADNTAEYGDTVEHMVIAREKEFRAPEGVTYFEKEIYSARNAAVLHRDTVLRALYSEQRAMIGSGVTVVRWADANDTLAVYDDCDLGISCSARNQLSVGHNCVFRRLYAPMIRIGQHPNAPLSPTDGRDMRIYRLPVQIDKENNVHYIHKEMIDDDGIANFSVISRHNVTVTEGLIVQGDIRSHKGVRLCDNAVVVGNIFAEHDVRLGYNTTVLGNIFSQGSIYFDDRASAGQWGKICSVIAREDISFGKDNFVFGYVCCEGTGVTQGVSDEERQERREAVPPDYMYLPTPERLRHLVFKDLYDFEHVDWQGYRNEPELEDVVIPAGAVKIQKSMFFDCPRLERAALPDSLVTIEPYAFADCCRCGELLDLERMPLEEIGTSAFENCKGIPAARFPSALRVLGGAAFAGCEGLMAVDFPLVSKLERVGDHCFRGCVKLESVRLPDSVLYVGVSAFSDCAALKEVSVPETCAEQAGVKELLERGVRVELRELPPPEDAPADEKKPETEAVSV